tara:strand:+ start:212 stop:433 length:222 start_codon:yes stop_codon:yes gene_type:complete
MNTEEFINNLNEVTNDVGALVHRIIIVNGFYKRAVDDSKSKGAEKYLKRAKKYAKHIDELQDELYNRYGIRVK